MSQLQKSLLLLGLFYCSSRSGSLAVCPGSSDIPEQALLYTAQPWPPGPLLAKDSPDRTELFSPLGVFLPFLENVKQRNGIRKKSISSDGGELAACTANQFGTNLQSTCRGWGPQLWRESGFNQPPLGHGDHHGQEGRGTQASVIHIKAEACCQTIKQFTPLSCQFLACGMLAIIPTYGLCAENRK